MFGETHESLEEMLTTLRRTTKMNLETFYWHIRPYFAGWQLVSPEGVHYAGVNEGSSHQIYAGISAAQSSLFRAFDIIFQVSHEEPGANYLRGMYEHMPSPHARFLKDLETNFAGDLRAFISTHEDLAAKYTQCLGTLAKFRAFHMGLVQKYAVQEASRQNKHRFGLAQTVTAGGGVQGAGGTPIKLFLKSTWERTREAMAVKTPFGVKVKS